MGTKQKLATALLITFLYEESAAATDMYPGHVTQILAQVVNSQGCALSKIFILRSGRNPVLAKKLAGRLLQVVTSEKIAGSPPIEIPGDINRDPNADIFEIIHKAYERHRDEIETGNGGNNTPGGGNNSGGGVIEWDDNTMNGNSPSN